MRKIIKFFKPRINPLGILRGKPNFKLVKGTRLTSALFIGASVALAAGIIFGANIYYDIDTGKIMVGDTQQSTTTQISVDTANTTALTVTQRGTAAAVSVTSTASMTSDIFKITNLGSGKSFVVEDSDTDSSTFIVDANGDVGIGTTTLQGLLTVGTSTPVLVVDRTGKVGVATSTPSDTFAVQGNIIGSGNITVYGTSATSTFGAGIQTTQVKITGGTIVDGYVLTATDALGNAQWEVIPTGVWTAAGGFIYQTTMTNDVAISTTTARSTYNLDVWGDFAVGTSTDYATPILFVDSGDGGKVGIGTTTLTNLLFSVGTTTPSLYVTNSGQIGLNNVSYTWPSSNGATGTYLRNNGSGTLTWATSTILSSSNWQFVSVNAIGPTSTNIGIIVNASSTISGFAIDASGNATTSGTIYAATFRSASGDATVRKSGDEIIRGVAPIFGFDLPARCNTSCTTPNWATTTRTIENVNFFPDVISGTTRKYRFSVRFATASTTASTNWQIATSSDNSSFQFTFTPSESTDLAKGFSTTTSLFSSLPSDNWFLRVRGGGSGGYDIQVYEVLLLGVDQVN